MISISNIFLTLHEAANETNSLYKSAAKKLRVNPNELKDLIIVRKSIDARRGHELRFQYQVLVRYIGNKMIRYVKGITKADPPKLPTYEHGTKTMHHRPIIVGFGPAGMFAALILAKEGYAPIVLERGECVEKRHQSVKTFWESGKLDPQSNVQFGEGGAGTFSDGKLTARSKDPRMYQVLKEFVDAGAPKSILYDAHPHLGTDRLMEIVKHIRETIIAHGGEVRFKSKVSDIEIEQGKVVSLQINDQEWINCDQVIFAIGHSARDTFQLFEQRNVTMEAKPFAVGVRIEHKQQLIDESQYHVYANHALLGHASYRLTHVCENGRGVYTFCMCPGGFVVPAASSEGEVVVNGMSESTRSEENANSALLVQVTPDDFGSGVLDGMYFQQQLEHKAFELGGGNYQAPVQLATDFINQRITKAFGTVRPSYALHTKFCDLNELFPSDICDSLKEGLQVFERKIHGFLTADALLTAVETRSSSPVKILRDETCRSVIYQNIYPCGEGAGYAGGIVSSAIDGIRCAEALMKQYQTWERRK